MIEVLSLQAIFPYPILHPLKRRIDIFRNKFKPDFHDVNVGAFLIRLFDNKKDGEGGQNEIVGRNSLVEKIISWKSAFIAHHKMLCKNI